MVRRFAIAALCTLAWAGAAQAEICAKFGSTQYARDWSICASSVLPAQGTQEFGPGNLAKEDGSAWCEGAAGDGIGEWVELRYGRRVRFRTLMIANGYSRSKATYADNGRVRQVRIQTDDGVSAAATLRDNDAHQEVRLPRWSNATRVRLTIIAVYPGAGARDTCLAALTPDLEETDRRK